MTFRKATNIVAVMVFTLVLCCVLGTKTLDKAGVPLPDWAEVDKTSSSLEGRQYASFPILSFESIYQGAFQSNVDKFFSDHVPARSSVVLANAAFQRSVIRVSNVLFHFKIYPTFFGSKYAYDETNDALFPLMIAKTNSNRSKLSNFFVRINALHESHPECSFSLFLAEYIGASNDSELFELTSKPLLQEDISTAANSELASGIKRYIQFFSNAEEYSDTHFKTDFHWNMDGAYAGYLSITQMLGADEAVRSGSIIACDYPVYEGSFARHGLLLDIQDDRVFDLDFTLPNYHVETLKDSGDNSLLYSLNTDNYQSFSFSKDITVDRYTEMFPSRKGGLTIIHNDEKEAGDTLLILGDSYARPIDRLLASSYKTTILYNPTELKGESISNMIEIYEPDEVLILLSVYSLFAHNEYSQALC